MAQRNPRYMNSKFDSTCCDCGRDIQQGERIRYLGRSQAECSSCMPAEQSASTAQSKPQTVDDWASALSWDDAAPIPGESIGAHNSTPVAEAIALRDSIKRPALEVVSNPPGNMAVINQALAESTPAAPVADSADTDQFTQSERAEGMACELLVVLVNAISVAGVTGRLTIADYCRTQGRNSDTASRGALWAGIARAVQQAS